MNFLKRRNDSRTKIVESKTASEEMVMQQAYNRMLRDQMNMAVNPAMNAAQGVAWNTANTATGQSILGTSIGSQIDRRIEQMFDYNRQMNISVINADNGYVIIMRPEYPGTNSRVLVAGTIEELRDLITSEMVTRKMEK